MTYQPGSRRTVHSVLFICEDNARRSLIAEALFRDAAGPHMRAFSAGLRPADTADPFTLSALALSGLGPDGLWPKSWEGFCGHGAFPLGTVVMFGEDVSLRLPRVFPGLPAYRVWTLLDDRPGMTRHSGVWRDIQRVRPLVADLVAEINASILESQREQFRAAQAAE